MIKPDDILISTDQSLIDANRVCHFIQNSYWGSGRSREAIQTSFRNSVCFSALKDGQQLGFARVVTDYAFHAYICDLFTFEDSRGLGIGKQLMNSILGHDELKAVSRYSLATTDAHDFYKPFGFETISDNKQYMVRG